MKKGIPAFESAVYDLNKMCLRKRQQAHIERIIFQAIIEDRLRMSIENSAHIKATLVMERARCADIALACDSNRGNEKKIAAAIRDRK